jgi:23S rRNA (pseudouridine1915-N3)-methyltransferase
VLSLHVLAVGKLRPFFREAADEYLRRLRRYTTVHEREVREGGKAGNPTAQRREEAVRLREALPDAGVTVALARTGSSWSSAELARRLGRWREEAPSVSFLIGGAEGLAPELIEAARYRWSLGPLTLPHELARVIVLEQLYRGFTILAGEKYHKGGE